MNITLRAHERLFLNGAVIRADRRVTIELLNDAVFLLENHVMQASEATTPLRQIYFVAQVVLMEGGDDDRSRTLALDFVEEALTTFKNEEIVRGLQRVDALLKAERYFDSLKALRALFSLEESELAASKNAETDAA